MRRHELDTDSAAQTGRTIHAIARNLQSRLSRLCNSSYVPRGGEGKAAMRMTGDQQAIAVSMDRRTVHAEAMEQRAESAEPRPGEQADWSNCQKGITISGA